MAVNDQSARGAIIARVTRSYRYIGPAELLGRTTDVASIAAMTDLDAWLARQEPDEPRTFVVDLDGTLRLAPRRSEHVTCAGGADVLAAGELRFERDADGWFVVEASNQSTGYCPDVDSWPALRDALDRAGVRHPGEFTAPVVFRRCPDCAAVNIVRDGDYTCALCDGNLPPQWNVV
ncbi:MAG: hypothetical protein HOU01_04375 [Streptomycetaceae bacterium]|nr:hypothetical protein [Streptomycetaceae bacterium]